jgi:Tfp pilus assembly protein PilO
MLWTLIGILITLSTACVSGIVWAIRLEGKVSEHDQLFQERKEQAKVQNDASTGRLDDLKDHLIRIENKLDTIAYAAIRNQPHA